MARQRTARSGGDPNTESGPTISKDPMRDQSSGSGGMADEAKDKATQLAGRAQEKMGQQLQAGASKGLSRAADALGSVAQSLTYSSERLREQDRGAIGGYVEKAANRVERFADYVQNSNPREMADRVENFARREPGLFLGGAFALGLLGARFIKSSRGEQQRMGEQHMGTAPYAGTGGTAGQETSRSRGTVSDREVPISRAPRESDLTGSHTSSVGAPGITSSGSSGTGSATELTDEGRSLLGPDGIQRS